MTRHRWVVLAERACEFDTREDACAFATRICPSVVCEWVTDGDGKPLLRERLRYDRLWDDDRGEWRLMLG